MPLEVHGPHITLHYTGRGQQQLNMYSIQFGACTVWGVYSVGCVQCGVCTVWGVYSVGCVQCGVCTVWGCTVWGVYSVGCVQCGACTVWGVYNVRCLYSMYRMRFNFRVIHG